VHFSSTRARAAHHAVRPRQRLVLDPDEPCEQLGHRCALGHARGRAKAVLGLYRGVAERRSQQVVSVNEPDWCIESALPLARGQPRMPGLHDVTRRLLDSDVDREGLDLWT